VPIIDVDSLNLAFAASNCIQLTKPRMHKLQLMRGIFIWCTNVVASLHQSVQYEVFMNQQYLLTYRHTENNRRFCRHFVTFFMYTAVRIYVFCMKITFVI